MTGEPTPVERHWRHVEALRHLYEGMPEGEAKARLKARWEAVLEDHRRYVAQLARQAE